MQPYIDINCFNIWDPKMYDWKWWGTVHVQNSRWCFIDKLNFKITNGTHVKYMPSHLQYEMVANQIINYFSLT